VRRETKREKRERLFAMSTRWGDDSDKSDHYRDEQSRDEPHEPRDPPRRKKLAVSVAPSGPLLLSAAVVLGYPP
jgi:hypothetical protein